MPSSPARRSTAYLGGALRVPHLHPTTRQRRPSSAEYSLTWLVDGLEQDARRGVRPQQLLETASVLEPGFKRAAAGLGSVSYARLLGFIARTSLVLGASQEATVAEQILEVALDELERSYDWSRDVVAAYVDAILSLVVSLKARGHDDDARQLLRATVRDPVLRRYRSDWDILPLFRQEVMMVGTSRAHIRLGEVARQYRGYGGPEYYGCVKRVFEFVLNHGARRDAERAFPLFALAFGSTRSRVTPLAELSFLKNAAQYFAVVGNPERADKLLAIACHAAESRQLMGQLRQIVALRNAVVAGERPLLETFRVSPEPATSKPH